MTGKTVIITGATSGLGKEAALDLSLRGARVILVCRSESSPSCYFFLSLVISRELLEEDHRIIRLLESSNHASVINIWLLSYSVSNYRDVVKGHEVAGGIKSETQVIDVWTAELTVITQRAK